MPARRDERRDCECRPQAHSGLLLTNWRLLSGGLPTRGRSPSQDFVVCVLWSLPALPAQPDIRPAVRAFPAPKGPLWNPPGERRAGKAVPLPGEGSLLGRLAPGWQSDRQEAPLPKAMMRESLRFEPTAFSHYPSHSGATRAGSRSGAAPSPVATRRSSPGPF